MNFDFKLINIIGIDGAGKTTLAKSLAKKLYQLDTRVRYRYCQYFAKLLYPIKYLAKISIMRKTDEFKDYKYYNETKKTTSSRFPFLANIYAGVWLIDYLCQILYKITIGNLFGKKYIIDRYIIDIAINLSLTTNNDINYAIKIINFFLILAPKPELVFFIDIPEIIAFNRKDDIQSLEYLSERRERYLYLCKYYKFIIINGHQIQSNVLNDVYKIIREYGEK